MKAQAIRSRDYAKIRELLLCPDAVHISLEEAALLTGYKPETLRQRKVKNFPAPVGPGRLLRWRLGDVKAWLEEPSKRPDSLAKEERSPRP
jgi:predicted DNA-binding transcriptional regulator AlpA